MLQMQDSETGLTLTLDVQSTPKNPRLVENNLFEIVTWTRGLGDPHSWRDAEHLLSSIDTDAHAIFKLEKQKTDDGSYLVMTLDPEAPPDGFAIASFELLKLEFDSHEITPEIMDKAEKACLAELLDHEHYACGQVFRLQIANRAGIVLAEQRDICGQDYAEHVARTVFERHRMSIIADG